MKFSSPSDNTGIIEQIARFTKTQSTTTSSYPIAQKTIDVNDALGNYFLLAIKAAGRFQVDDTNQSDMPVITTSIVSGQADYQFILDGSPVPNQILDVRSVRIQDPNGVWLTRLKAIDREQDNISKYQGQTGIPEAFDVSNNEVILYPTPNYSISAGMELYISRTPSYFLSTDTTKQAGLPNLFDSYLYMRPAYFYCLVNTLPAAQALGVEVKNTERQIMEYYSRRDRVDKPRMGSSSNHRANSTR